MTKTCNDCGQPYTGNRCGCGDATRQQFQSIVEQAPAPVDVLAGAIRSWQLAGRLCPAQLPSDPLAAAKFWINCQQPRAAGEVARQVPIAGTESRTRWIDPYADRIKASFWAFCSSRVSFAFRQVILAGAGEKIWWRGEDEKTFSRILDEAYDYKVNPAMYRKQASEKIKATLRKLSR